MSEKLTSVSKTLYVPLAGRIYSSHKFPHIVNDVKALMIEKNIEKSMDIFKGQTEYTLMASAVRSKNMDLAVKEFLSKHPDGVIVNLGCGLETIFYRCDNECANWYELDLPEVIQLREELLGKEKREITLAYSIFDDEWLEIIKEEAAGKSVCFTASGLFYYFSKGQVLELMKKLCFIPNARLVFDTVNSIGMKQMARYMKQIGHEKAEMFFFVDDAKDLASEISDTVTVMEERDYYSEVKNRKGMKLMTRISMSVSDKFHMVKMIRLKLN